MIPGISATRKVTRIRVDASKCTGHGVCVDVAPQLFALDRFGFAYVVDGAAELLLTDGEARALAREAEVKCPDRAILVERLPEPKPSTVKVSSEFGDPGPRLIVDAASDRYTLASVASDAYDPTVLLEAVSDAGIAGHGGARFNVAAKWRTVGRGDVVVVANGAEREPGTMKDRHLLVHRPYAVLHGLGATARAVGARSTFVAIDADHSAAIGAMEAAIADARAMPLFDGISIELRMVPPRYVAGEESALLQVLDGNAPLPRVRPPFPTVSGYRSQPTVIHNVETLTQIGLIAQHGADWFRTAGTTDEPGTGIFSVGVFGAEMTPTERPYGYTLRTLLDEVGLGDDIAGVIVGGWSGGVLRPDQLDVGLTHAQLVAQHASLGTKSIQVIPNSVCILGVAAEVVGYFGGESAGQCPSCEQGLPWIAEGLRALDAGTASREQLDEITSFAVTLPRRGACAMPDGAIRFLQSVFTNFPEVVDDHLDSGCSHVGETTT